MADQPAGPVARSFKVYDFAALSRREPNRQQPGDRLDAQFSNLIDAVNGLARTVELQADAIVKLGVRPGVRAGSDPAGNPLADPLEGPQVLGPNAGGPYATDQQGATATSADYAQVAIAWAENMPWTIPGNILAINAISGNHWSSRWWADRAQELLSVLMVGGLAMTQEDMPVSAVNTFAAPLAQIPADADTTMVLFVNGRAFFPGSFAVSPPGSANIIWTDPHFSVAPGDQVIARYRYSVGVPPSAGYAAISLYYLAVQGQTAFPLSELDCFAVSYALKPTSVVHVYRNGLRLMAYGGPSAPGGYSLSGDVVTLAWAAGENESVVVDVWEKYPQEASL